MATPFVLIITGLVLLSFYFILSKWGTSSAVTFFIVASVISTYYGTITQYPKYLGYPVDIKLIDMDESRAISAFEGRDELFVVVIHKGETKPRLISMEKTEENKKQHQELNKKLKQGAVVVKKSGGKGKGGEYDEPTGDLKLVPISEQTIMKKDE